MAVSTRLTSPARTGNLVLKTRVAVVIRNLEQVQGALETVKQRRGDLSRLLSFPARVDQSIGSLERWLGLTLTSSEARDWMDVEKGLDNFKAEIADLKGAVDALREPIAHLKAAALLESEVARADEVAKAVHESLEREMFRRFGNEFADLQSLQETIGAATRNAGGNGAEAMTESWARYIDKLFESSETLFAEYVELVGGVAIRDTGFDRGICRLAEDALKPLGSIANLPWSNLTIPARQEALAVTAARIVRLGFPEWTIWRLPLTTQALGNIYVAWDRDVESVFERYEGEAAEARVLLADVFATYFMGPAYACPAILMRLNPAEAFADQRLVAKRVGTILTSLRRMSHASAQDHYEPITSRLAVEWEDALRQTGWDGPEPGNRAGAAVTWLPAEERAALRERTGLTEDEQEAIERLVTDFEPYVLARQLDLDAWPSVQKWAKKLGAGAPLDARSLNQYDELRYVLNAAWRARIAVAQEETDLDDPDVLKRIAEAVEQVHASLHEAAARSEVEDEWKGGARPKEQRQSRGSSPPRPAGSGSEGAA
jgi:hypothetical protein